MNMRYVWLSIAVVGAMLSVAAEAHPKLVSASPAPNATVGKLTQVKMRFSEKLLPAFSKADLMMAAMPGMAAMTVTSTAAVINGQTLVVTSKQQLHPGRYTVAWHVVSTDTHKVAGSYAFTVK
jgi:methionine-rich copper-binding protein CopC